MTDNTTDTNTKVSFADDIVPIFYQFKKQMMWRFDLTNYDDVKANYGQILSRISSKDNPMPPPPFAPLSQKDIDTFKAWKTGNFQQ